MLATCGIGYSVCVDDDGNVWSFGRGDYGELGHGKQAEKVISTPTMIQGLEEIALVSSGFYHTVCLDRLGALWSFGINIYGNLGLGDNKERYTPHKIPLKVNIVTFSCGYNHTVCADENGNCYSFGLNESGQLGVGDIGRLMTSPQLITSLKGSFITSVACKGAFSLFLDEKGRVKATGDNSSGQLGIGNTLNQYFPQDVLDLENIVTIRAGYMFSCFLDVHGVVFSCGENTRGQLGHGDNIQRHTPTKIESLRFICDLGCGYTHAMFIDEDRKLWGVGANNQGQLGLADLPEVLSPELIPNIDTVSSISGSTYHNLVKLIDGDIMVFGQNEHSQLGIKYATNTISTAVSLTGYSFIIKKQLGSSRAKSARK